MIMYRHRVGDWMYGDTPGTFLKIDSMETVNSVPMYGVSFFTHVSDDESFKHNGALHDYISERRLRPVTNRLDSLLCFASDLRDKHKELIRQASAVANDIESTMLVRRLFEKAP